MSNFVSFSDTEKNEKSFSHLTVDAVQREQRVST